MVLVQRQHGVHIETPSTEMSLLPRTQFQLTATLGFLGVDASRSELCQTLRALVLIEDMDELVAGLKPLCHERQHDAIFLLFVGKEGADMTGARLGRSGKLDRRL